jgi:hypothetical protein
MNSMPHSRKWQALLGKQLGPYEAARVMDRSFGFYLYLLMEMEAEPPIPVRNRMVAQTLKNRVYPALSVYKTLLDVNILQADALALMEILIKADFFGIMLFGIRLLDYLPDPFPIIKPALKLMTSTEYLPGTQQVITDSRDCFALNTYRCFTLEALTAYHASELTVLFCRTDDWLSEALPKVGWDRTKTLANGDDLCNFRWFRIH